jgi:hypothetical protein
MANPLRGATKEEAAQARGIHLLLWGKSSSTLQVGGAAAPTISNAEEGSLPSRPGSKDAESDIGYASLSNWVSKPKANLARNQTHLAEADEATWVELPPVKGNAQKANRGHDRWWRRAGHYTNTTTWQSYTYTNTI